MLTKTLTLTEAKLTKERIANYPQGVDSNVWGYGPMTETASFAFDKDKDKDKDVLREYG
jgi:hypothetical protein